MLWEIRQLLVDSRQKMGARGDGVVNIINGMHVI
jgi:hypothetical protein